MTKNYSYKFFVQIDWLLKCALSICLSIALFHVFPTKAFAADDESVHFRRERPDLFVEYFVFSLRPDQNRDINLRCKLSKIRNSRKAKAYSWKIWRCPATDRPFSRAKECRAEPSILKTKTTSSRLIVNVQGDRDYLLQCFAIGKRNGRTLRRQVVLDFGGASG